MKRVASKAIVLTALAVLGLSGEAAAFTPVPIPTPRSGSAAVAHLAHDRSHAITRIQK